MSRRALVAVALLACSGRGRAVTEPEVDPDDEDAASACKAVTEDDLAQAEMLALGGHLHRALALAEASDRRCSTAGSRWMCAEILADLGLDARSIAGYQRYAREARTARGKAAALEVIEELRKRPAPVRPDASNDERATALLLYRDGVNLRLGGRYDDAIRQLRRSYALLPHPLTIAQIALAHEDAGRAVEALKAHERALAIAEQLAGARAVPRLLRGHVARIEAMAWSRDGRRLVTAGRDELVAVWEPATGRILHSFTVPKVIAVAISADGGVVAAAGTGGEVIVWDAVSGAVRSTFPPRITWWAAVALSPDGSLVAAGGDGGVEVRPSAGGEPVGTIAEGSSTMRLAFTGDGARIATIRGTHVDLWAPTGGAAVLRTDHASRIGGAAFAPDGSRMATVEDDGALILRELPSGRTLRTVPYEHGATDVAWSGDGQVIATCGGKHLRIWDAATLEVRRDIEQRAALVALSADGGTVATASADPLVRTWDTTAGTPSRTLGSLVDTVAGIGFSADGRLLAVTRGTGVDLWRLDAVRSPRRVELGGESLQDLAVDPRGRWAVAVDGVGKAHRIDIARGTPVQTWTGVAGVAASTDGELLAWAGGRHLETWKPTGAKLGGTTWGADVELRAVALSPDASLAAVGGLDGLHVQRTSGAFVWEGPVDSPIWALDWSPAGDLVATAHVDGSLRVWKAAAFHERPVIVQAHQGRVFDVAYARDGALLATAGADGRVALWDGRTGAPRADLGRHASRARAVAFSASGRLLASGGEDGVVIVWDVTTRARLATLHVAGGQWLVLAEDGRIDGAQGRTGGAGLVYWLAGTTALPGLTGWDRAHTPGLLRELFAAPTGRSRSGRSSAPGR